MEISRYIKELLINKDNVIVAGFGAFEKTFSSARIDPVTGEMHPPQTTVVLRPELKTDSGILAKYVAEKESITEETARELIQNQVAEWEKALGESQTVLLPGLGSLAKDNAGESVFTPTVEPSDFPESYGLPVISVQEKSGTVPPPLNKQEEVKKQEEKKPVEKKPLEKKIPAQKKPIQPIKKPVTETSRKSNNKLIVGLIIGIPVAALIVLGLLYPEIAKQKFTQATKYVSSIFKGKDKPAETNLAIVTDTLTAEDSAIMETEAILENYTIVNSETNARLEPKIEQLSDARKVYIIAGSFKIRSYATRLKKQLNKKGFNAEVLPINNGLYRVSVASFDDVQSATEDFSRIKSIDESLDVWLLINK